MNIRTLLPILVITVAGFFAMPACAHASSGGAAVKACAESDIATAKNDANQVIADASYNAELDKLAGDLGACAVRSGLDLLIKEITAELGNKASVDPLLKTKLQHAQAWLAAHPSTSATSGKPWRMASGYPSAPAEEIDMGNWNITIRGVGVHHNRGLAIDANKMAARFVEDLKAAGHSVIGATVTYGGEDNVTDGAAYLADREKIESA